MSCKFIIFAGKEKCEGGIYDIYKMADTIEDAFASFITALDVDKNEWAHVVSLEILSIILDSKECKNKKNNEELKTELATNYSASMVKKWNDRLESIIKKEPEPSESYCKSITDKWNDRLESIIKEDKKIFKLPELDLSKSKNWIRDSYEKFGRNRDPAYIGFNNESNILIPENRLVVGGYPKHLRDYEEMQKMGINTIVCLNEETGFMRGDKICNDWVKCPTDNITTIYVPIKDMGITEDNIIMNLCVDLRDKILNGDKIFVHCAGGHGRTGTVVCVLLHLLYPELTLEEIYDYVQFSHDQRTGSYGNAYFTYKLNDPQLAMCFRVGQVPTPQTSQQRNQVERLVNIDILHYLDAKQSYDNDTYLQHQIRFDDWYKSILKYEAEEKKQVETELIKADQIKTELIEEDLTKSEDIEITFEISRTPEKI
jgi:hypothetical protein